MRFSYDSETDSLYVHLTEAPGADVVEVADDVVADLDEAGQIVGLDIQHASRFDLSTLDVSGLPSAAVTLRAAA